MVYIKKPHHNSDDSLQWDEFFGTSVDISTSLLDMYDSLASQSKTTSINNVIDVHASNLCWDHKSSTNTTEASTTAAATADVQQEHAPSSSKEPLEKKRPLSLSSLSSSSSSSSSSLPRNALDVKKSYLASIESLDDEFSEDGTSCSEPKWSNFRDKIPSHIERVLQEIVETERTYVRDLKEIIEGYLHHEHLGLSEVNLKELFGNIEDICHFNSVFLADLEPCALDAVTTARCFVQHGNGFAVYTQYCTNYPRTVAILTDVMRNRDTAEIFKARQRALHHSLPLGSYLLKPVQRILKYHLLLQNIVLHMDKESAGYLDMKNALSVMTGIAYHINEMKRKHEHAVRVQEIQSLLYGWQGRDLTTYGELVAEGSFRMLGAKALRHIFLFDKILLIAKKKEESILLYKAHIMCSDLMLIESIRGEPLCFHVIPFLNPRMQFTFQARNVEQKREWCLQLKQVILENYNAVIPSHARQLVLELGQSRSEDSGPSEKISTRHLLSAPEYLERRRHERRKSTNSNNNGGSSGKPADNKVTTRRTRGHRDASSEIRSEVTSSGNWNLGRQQLHKIESTSTDERSKPRRGRMARRTWNEETTDTENDEANRGFPSWHNSDPTGEYVMFYFPRGRTYDPPPSPSTVSPSSVPPVETQPSTPPIVTNADKSPAASSWRQYGAVRRVQSFTGLARAKVASLHHNFSFSPSRNRLSGPRGPLHSTVAASLTETTPAWLDDDASGSGKKCDSLPRSFRPGSDSGTKISDSRDDVVDNQQTPSMQSEDEPAKNEMDLQNNREKSSKTDLHKNVHPEHKIYFRPTSGRAVVKNLISTVGSRFALFRGANVSDSVVLCSEESSNVRRVSSRSSLWSERDIGRKNIGNKLMQSIARVYGAKGRPKRDKGIPENVSEDNTSPHRYRTNSLSLGARMAQPLESEYCVPSSLLSLSHLADERPHSLLSQSSSNTTTTSSSADKMWSCTNHPPPPVLDSDQDDSLSDASATSADSYYERTFEEIENILTEEMFRDSAIYSDPEDADLSAAETSSFSKRSLLSERIELSGSMEEVGKAVTVECCTLSVQERRLELERWCIKEGEEMINEGGKNGLPLMKGWVKHVVSKLQGDDP